MRLAEWTKEFFTPVSQPLGFKSFFGWIGIIPLFTIFAYDFLIIDVTFLRILSTILVLWGVTCYIHFFKNKIHSNLASKIKSSIASAKILNIFFFLLIVPVSGLLTTHMYVEFLYTNYFSNDLIYVIILLFGTLAFSFLPYLSTALLIFIQTVNTINFFGKNVHMLLDGTTFSSFYASILVFTLLLLKLIKNKSFYKNFLANSIFVFLSAVFPYLLTLIIYYICQSELFSKFYLSFYPSELMRYICCALFLWMCCSLVYPYLNEKQCNIGLVLYLIIIIHFLIPLKAQASKFHMNQLLRHDEFYTAALAAENNGNEEDKIILLQKAANAGNPKALYKVANNFFIGESMQQFTLESIDQNLKQFYLAGLLGEPEALETLRSYARKKQSQTNLRELARSFYESNIDEYTHLLARYYIGIYFAIDRCSLKLEEDNKQIQNARTVYRNKGKEILSELINSPIRQRALVMLSNIAFIEKNIDEGRKLLEEAASNNPTPETLYYLGRRHLVGMGYPSNIKKAVMYLSQAKDKNHDDATYLWAMAILDNDDFTPDDKLEARTYLMRLYAEHHPGARFTVALRFIRNDPSLEGVTLSDLQINSDDLDNTSLKSGSVVVQEGIDILRQMASIGSSAEFNESGYAYTPTLFGQEIVYATYQLALIYFKRGQFEDSLALLKQNTQRNHQYSLDLINKIESINFLKNKPLN